MSCNNGGNYRKLGNVWNCEHCYLRSFASHKRAENWSKRNIKSAREVCKSSASMKYIFDCTECKHEFEALPANVSRTVNSRWCPYCANQKLCGELGCTKCLEKSLASHPSIHFWSKRNSNIDPKTIFRGANLIKYWYDCECGHDFDITPNNVTRGRWCPHCSKFPKKLCDNLGCYKCGEKSFASHPKSKFWSHKNTCSPRDVLKYSHANILKHLLGYKYFYVTKILILDG